MTFEQYYKSLGLERYPFTTFTTELEKETADRLFVPMSEYGPILESFRAYNTIIVLGERGVGKTAVLEEFHRQAKGMKVYAVVTDYGEITEKTSSSDFHELILRNLLISVIGYLGNQQNRARRMTKRDRVLLSYLVFYYSDELTAKSIKDTIDNIQIRRVKRVLSSIFNKVRQPLNYAANVLESGVKRYIAQHFRSIPFYEESVLHEFFPEINLTSDTTFREGADPFALLKRLCELIVRISGHKAIALLDKLDEDQRLANDADIIASFVEPLLTDNSLLGLTDLQSIIFVWKTPYRFIEDRVRSQKYFCPTIKWDKAALKAVLDKRLEVFSNGKIRGYRALFENPDGHAVDTLFTLANGIPRDLWHLMNKVFEEQHRINPESLAIEDRAVERAVRRFVTEFNYYEYYPRKAKARRDTMDVYSYYAHLRKVNSTDFTKNQLNARAGTGSSTNNYIVGMERIGLIERLHQERGQVLFRIRDAKIIYAIENELDLRSE